LPAGRRDMSKRGCHTRAPDARPRRTQRRVSPEVVWGYGYACGIAFIARLSPFFPRSWTRLRVRACQRAGEGRHRAVARNSTGTDDAGFREARHSRQWARDGLRGTWRGIRHARIRWRLTTSPLDAPTTGHRIGHADTGTDTGIQTRNRRKSTISAENFIPALMSGPATRSRSAPPSPYTGLLCADIRIQDRSNSAPVNEPCGGRDPGALSGSPDTPDRHRRGRADRVLFRHSVPQSASRAPPRRGTARRDSGYGPGMRILPAVGGRVAWPGS